MKLEMYIHCTCSSKLNIALRVVAVQLTPLTMESSPTSLMDYEYITNTINDMYDFAEV